MALFGGRITFSINGSRASLPASPTDTPTEQDLGSLQNNSNRNHRELSRAETLLKRMEALFHG